MGKNKKGPKANVFKVAGAKSLKKTKAKAVNLGLKNIKQKVTDIDKEFIEITKTPKPAEKKPAPPPKPVKKPQVSKEDMSKAADQIDKMDL